jgi:hypothetical protein
MAVDIKKLIAAISPDVYCDPTLIGEVKKTVKEEGYLKAAEVADLKDSDYMDIIHTQMTSNAFSLPGMKEPIEQHSLVYDAVAQNLEPIYFWILDFVNGMYGESEKLIDNFISSPGSGHFAELQGRATAMQREGSSMLQTAGALIKSVLQLIYDLKEFKMMLAPYDDLRHEKKKIRDVAVLSLKQRWLDNVDIKRGGGSIAGMTQQLDFVTLRDGFLAAEGINGVDKLDLNERVKRILKQRISEFEHWIKESEDQLRKRFELEKISLKSQVNTIKLHARWAKPYLKAAQQLEQRASANASLVNAFNTSLFELVVLAKGRYDLKKDVAAGELPKSFENMKFRKYSPIAIIEFKFRSIPGKQTQRGDYTFTGRAEVKFTSFALNDDELEVLREQIEKDDIGDVMAMIQGAADESLDQIQDDIDEFLGDGEKKKVEEESKDINPFSALFSFLKWKKNEEKDFSKGIPKDSFNEKVLRSQAILAARLSCRTLYDTYKKAHAMPAFPPVMQ